MLDARLSVLRGQLDLNVEFTMGSDETIVVVGPNGAGKTTLLRAVAGLTPLDNGRLERGSVVWDDPAAGVFVVPERRNIGFVFQSHALIAHLDARSNVAFGLRATGMARASALSRADALLDQFDVGAIRHHLPHQLSGGQSQRVAIARAIATDPSVVLLDEPFSALDARGRSTMRDIFGDANATARIIVSHDPVDALTIADRVMVLEAGVVTQFGRPSELIAAPRSNYVAEILGLNPLRGMLSGHRLDVGDTTLTVGAHTVGDGPVIAVIRPRSISLHRAQPEGSPRNVWRTRVVGVDRLSDRVRVRVGDPLVLTVEVTHAGLEALGVGVGDGVWASVKASEIDVSEG